MSDAPALRRPWEMKRCEVRRAAVGRSSPVHVVAPLMNTHFLYSLHRSCRPAAHETMVCCTVTGTEIGRVAA
jgi:hypothetical protein